MKKIKQFLIPALSALALVGCSQGLSNQQSPMLGQWVCTTNYYNLKIRTEDFMDFDKDGIITVKSAIILPISKTPTFVYHQAFLGKWVYNAKEKIMSIYPAEVRTEAMHSKETMRKLKTDKDLQKFEKELYETLQLESGEPVEFKLIKQEGDAIFQEQKMGDHSYFPVCLKGETFDKKVQSGEINLNPNY